MNYYTDVAGATVCDGSGDRRISCWCDPMIEMEGVGDIECDIVSILTRLMVLCC